VIDLRPVFLIIGILLIALALGMVLPAMVDLSVGNADWQVFAVSAGLTLFVGLSMTLTCRAGGAKLNIRQAFVMTTFSWLAIALFGSLPFVFCELQLSFTDAFFESMSGVTTTGSTVITGLDSAPPGILLWRALLQWLGGIGIVVMAIAVFPMLRVGGMQLFRMESSSRSEKALPRAAQIATAIGAIYLILTLAWALAYWIAGMTGFDAIAHSMTTIATGGFSTSDQSLAHFGNPAIDVIAITGMLVGSLPFLLYLRTLQGNLQALFQDTQVQWFLSIVVLSVLTASAWLWLDNGQPPLQALRYAAFNIVSVITGTGYVTADYFRWGNFAVPMFFYIMFVGGCAGSTTCGIKIFRFQVLYAAARNQLRHLLQPHGVFIPYYNGRPITDEVMTSVLSFFFVFGVCFALLAIALGMVGMDYISAVSSAATAIANVGPALGPEVGPSGTFKDIPDAAKWLMAGGMILGRLELFTIIVLFTRSFWRG
jgi:trk system potassium uptake protein